MIFDNRSVFIFNTSCSAAVNKLIFYLSTVCFSVLCIHWFAIFITLFFRLCNFTCFRVINSAVRVCYCAVSIVCSAFVIILARFRVSVIFDNRSVFIFNTSCSAAVNKLIFYLSTVCFSVLCIHWFAIFITLFFGLASFRFLAGCFFIFFYGCRNLFFIWLPIFFCFAFFIYCTKFFCLLLLAGGFSFNCSLLFRLLFLSSSLLD